MTSPLARGVSLIEALIAMAVMAFGMLALVGVQSTMRFNADVARQRAEATRIAEQEAESIRTFLTVGTGGTDATEFDSLSSAAAKVVGLDEANAKFTLVRDVVNGADGLQRAVNITVSWVDRGGTTRNVIVRDLVTRAEPALSGLVSSVRKLTAVGRRDNRHPTIPPRAHDLNDGRSIFKPRESGTVAWVFNNLTGQITHVCTVDVATTSATLDSATVTTSCTELTFAAQLLTGTVRFNFRGLPNAVAGIGQAFKPVPGGTVAWVIDPSLSQVVSQCTVGAGTSTASLTPGDLSTCTPLSPARTVAPYSAADSTYTLQAIDSEDPLWPTLNLNVSLHRMTNSDWVVPTYEVLSCHADGPTTAAGAVLQSAVDYFCLIPGSASQSWAGFTQVVPEAFADAGVANWSTSGAGAYRVCRYTKATTNYTSNEDHPQHYARWKATCGQPAQEPCRLVTGNLVNQNFLVIPATKSCPTDVAANPATGDMVNSNTLQHQP